MSGVSWAELAARLGSARTSQPPLIVTGLHHDSRRVAPGELFVALPGRRSDGASFAAQAVARGAVAVIAERELPELGVPCLVVPDARRALALAAAQIYGDPSRALRVVGVTGTNGKSTTCELVRFTLAALGHRPAIMGTLGTHFAGHSLESDFNTPEADELTRSLAWLRDAGASHLVLEATSHGIAERRLDGVFFSCVAYTNLTHDHLDLHGSFAAYRDAKARLFRELAPRAAAVLVDDELGATLADELGARALRVSAQLGRAADLRLAAPPTLSGGGLTARLETPEGELELRSPLVGQHNLANLLVALGILHQLGIPLPSALPALAECGGVPGRLERCDGPDDDLVALVDYAHTPDGLEQALKAARLYAAGRVTCVFGCGGDRDPTKRAPMGEVAGRLADRVFVTNDNPRSEAPSDIARAIVAGLGEAVNPWEIVLDREAAITRAVAEANAGEVVLIAGKGHERTQTIGRTTLPFDDRSVLRAALAARRERLASAPIPI